MGWTKRKDIMLCQPLEDSKLERLFKNSSAVFTQAKLDGIRAWYDVENDSLISSEGHDISSVPHVRVALHAFEEITGLKPLFDGELYIHGKPFEYISSVVSRRINFHPDYLDMQYHVFDLRLLNDTSQAERLTKLTKAFNVWDLNAPDELRNVLRPVYAMCATSIDEVHEQYRIICMQNYEGIIVRQMSAPYKIGRPWWILKFKPKKEDEYHIVKINEAYSADGRPLGRVGSIVCADNEGNTFNVGAGVNITIEDSVRYWQDYVSGKRDFSHVRVVYQNLTATGNVPRFGKFVELW